MKKRRLDRSDISILLLLVLSVGGILWRHALPSREGSEEVFTVQGEWAGVPAETAACLQVGDLLYTEAGERFGRVLQILGEESRDRQTLRLFVAVTGSSVDGVLYRGRTKGLYVGETYLLYSDRARILLRILSYGEASDLAKNG